MDMPDLVTSQFVALFKNFWEKSREYRSYKKY